MRSRVLSLAFLLFSACAGDFDEAADLDDEQASLAGSYTLSVSVPPGAGKVTSSPAGIDCPKKCSARFAAGSTVTLTARGNNGVGGTAFRFSNWFSGPCLSSKVRSCAVQMTGDRSAGASFVEFTNHLAFVSSATYPANQGGRSGFDARCNELATAAGINNAAGNAYLAWLSTTGLNAIDRLTTRGFERVDGARWVEASPVFSNDGLPPTFYSDLSIDENGASQIGKEVFSCSSWTTGTQKDACCNGWSSGGITTTLGHTTMLAGDPGGWWCDADANETCSLNRRVYCLMNVDP